MKNRKLAAWIGTVLLLTVMAGCGDSSDALWEQSFEEQSTEHEKEGRKKL